MFCDQCEQAAGGTGCASKIGTCGKNEDIHSLQDTLIYGLKGIAAYAYHAREFGARDEEVDAFMHEALFTTLTNVSFDLNQHLDMALRCGRINLKIMELLNNAHTKAFGNPVPTIVEIVTKKGPGILVTGHDLLALEKLLKQAEPEGVNIYTHGEMLPAHGYPGLKKFKNLVGNYGGAWQDQKDEFKYFSGPILITTNCVQIPHKDTYLDRLFTMGITGVPGAKHITEMDFSQIIKMAKSLPPLLDTAGTKVSTGFHYTAVLGLADKIKAAVTSGKIKHFFLVGGCDGAKTGRSYYTEFAKMVPKDCVIVTLACGKYRFNKLDFGDIDGIPRLIDVGQCNDAYSAIQIALALAKLFDTDVNKLPLSFVISWYEQKAVVILLTLLYLGIKGMYIGPTPPAFFTKNVLQVVQDKFDLRLIGNPRKDLEEMLSRKR